MADKAHVSSLEAIEAFRSHLIVYVSKARPALEEVSADMLRVRSWLENDQRSKWENEIRKRQKAFEQATQELFSARLSKLSQSIAVQQLAAHRAKRALDEAMEKLRVIKRWAREFEGRVQPLVKQVEKLHTVFTKDMAEAVVHLGQVVKTLSAYAELAAPTVVTQPSTTTTTENADEADNDSK
jgi:hypothetical protein